MNKSFKSVRDISRYYVSLKSDAVIGSISLV